MAKTSGGTRNYKPNSSAYQKRLNEVERMKDSGKYSSVEIFDGGGYLAIEKSEQAHKTEEIAAANILARKGYKMILVDEGKQKKDYEPTIDGKVYAISYEQRTPTKDRAETIRNALFHAKRKHAEVALVYSVNHTFTRKSTEEGIKQFEKTTDYRFKQIIIVADNGNVHRYKHNK